MKTILKYLSVLILLLNVYYFAAWIKASADHSAFAERKAAYLQMPLTNTSTAFGLVFCLLTGLSILYFVIRIEDAKKAFIPMIVLQSLFLVFNVLGLL